MSQDHDMMREALGAHALGQVGDPALVEAIEAHLPTCEDCRAELADLAPVAQALRAARGDVGHRFGPTPPELDERVSSALADLSAPRSRRWVPAAAGLLAGAIAATIVSVVVLPDRTREVPVAGPQVVAVSNLDVTSGVTATVGLVDHTWGLELKLSASGLPSGQTYDVEVIGRDGTVYDAGEFIGVDGRTITCSMSSSVLLSNATSFTITGADGRPVIWGDLPT